MPWRQRRSSLPSKRTGSPCTCVMGTWISTMCSWEAVTQPSSSTTGCILEYRYRTCTVSCARSWKSTDGIWTWDCPCWIPMKGCCPWSQRRGDVCTTCSFILKNTGNSLTFTTTPTRPGYRPGILTNCGAWRNSSRPGTAF